MELFHNSQSPLCRSPLGAVPAGTDLTLRLFAQGHPHSVTLRLWNGEEHLHPMAPDGLGGYAVTVKLEGAPMLWWYDFRIEDERGRRLYYGNAHDRLGGQGVVYQDSPPSYQITAYDPDFAPPAFLSDGIMYQIFPDRFHRSKLPQSPRKDVVLHDNWEDLPLVDPDPRSQDNRAFDFFGGDLKGIQKKLPYLKELGVTMVYLNPIFKARSNHRYDTGDYLMIDPLLGTDQDFESLCKAADKLGIRLVLDGVFSHTGEDSLYFNRYGNYPGVGAYQSKDSAYYPWYHFTHFPDRYAAWWGIPTLPEINKNEPSYRAFILGPDGVGAHWVQKGAQGWRLDVADELPMSFLRELRQRVRATKKDAVLLGEVWEDASNKVAYGKMRSYCLGDSLDSVMNYPLRDAVINFLTGRQDAGQLVRLVRSLQENYPVPFFYSLMNLMGSHDRARILNVLVNREFQHVKRENRGKMRLSDKEYGLAKERFKKMLSIFLALPGMPAIFYGDEAGMQGAADPFCRGPYPWNKEDAALVETVRQGFHDRHNRRVLRSGFLEMSSEGADCVVITRFAKDGKDVFGKPLDEPPYVLRVYRDGYKL